MTVPDWVQDATFYQIFPDRFANGDPGNDPVNVQPWGAPPAVTGFQGGDLRGISDHLDYLVDLGVTAVYLNPIFQAGSNHRYNASDYLKIDERLGTADDFHRLVDGLHRRGLRLILDGVFNHSGRGFFAFRDLLDRGKASEHRSWYHVRRFPLDAFGDGKAERYAAWWGFRSLPKFNTDHPPVRSYLMNVARHWIEQGADGWRLDVPNEIDDDGFWSEFRDVVRTANPEAYLLGEIWEVEPRWVGEGAFDGLMNYPQRTAMLDLVVRRALTPARFRAEIEHQRGQYPQPNLPAQYNLLGSHDTERIATLAGGDDRRVSLLFGLLFALPGAPAIYYGDEIGLRGGKDPACRGAFPWDPSRWDVPRRSLVAALGHLRQRRIELRRGSLEFLLADEEGRLAFVRRHGAEVTAFVANLSDRRRNLLLENRGHGWPAGREVVDSLSQARHTVSPDGLRVVLDPMHFVLLES